MTHDLNIHMVVIRYIDLFTVAVFMDFFVFNPNMNYWVGCRADVEFPKSGGVSVTYQISPVRLYTWPESDLTVFTVLEVCLAVCYAYVASPSWEQGPQQSQVNLL